MELFLRKVWGQCEDRVAFMHLTYNLGRFADVSAHIRVACIQNAKDLLLYHPHLAEDVARTY